MTHITKLTEIIDGRLLPSDKKLSASLLEVDVGRLTVSENTLGFDDTGLATETFVSNAIASAQLDGGEVDLSGYATKDDLAGYATLEGMGQFEDVVLGKFDSKVDEIEGKGLSTNDFTDAHKTAVESIETTVSTAIAAVVDGAPETFDTLREIAEWIETEGAAATDLATELAGKADKSDLAEFKNETEINALIDDRFENIYGPGMASNLTTLSEQILLTNVEVSTKVDKVEGKGLSTEDFTTAYKTKLDGIDEALESLEDQKLNIPTETDPSTVTTPTVNSIPLYTLGNNGEYVLSTPDTWFLINGFYVPGYSATTLGV